MKTIFSLFIILIVTMPAHANPEWRKNKVRQQAADEAILAVIDEIPIYTERLEGNYDILAPVHGQDILSRKRDAIYYQVRETAYKIGADAIMEFSCKPMLKSVFLACDGFAIKYK